jgi:hypothetical protein
MTILGFTNYILQIFFIRLTRNEEKRIKSLNLTSYSIGQGIAGTIGDSETVQWYSIMYFVVPFTGSGYQNNRSKTSSLGISSMKQINNEKYYKGEARSNCYSQSSETALSLIFVRATRLRGGGN